MELIHKPSYQPRQAEPVSVNSNNEGVSAAFRKLLRRVSTQMSDLSEKKAVSRSSFSFFHNEQLQKKRKASVSLFQKRRGSRAATNFKQYDNRQNQTQMIRFERENETELRAKFNESPSRSVRCHSNPALASNSKALIRMRQDNEFLRAKAYQFKEDYTIRSAKNTQKISFFSRTPQGCQNSENYYQSKIKCGQKRRQFNNIVKSKQSFNQSKTDLSKKQGSWEPWEFDKFEQFCFINH